MQLESLSEWVDPVYLDVGVQKQIQLQFEEDSQIELPHFLLVSNLDQGKVAGRIQLEVKGRNISLVPELLWLYPSSEK